MRLSSKGRYGVRALHYLAYHHEGGSAQLREVADRAGIPARFLEQILFELRRAGLVAAKRGPRGGYALARPAAEITVGQVVRALEGAAVVVAPAEGREPKDDPVALAFAEIATAVERCFDQISLADLNRRAERMGVPRGRVRPPEEPDYAI